MVFQRRGRFDRVLDPVEMDRFDPAEGESVAMFSLDDDGALTAKNSAAQEHMDQLNETELISLIRGLYLNKNAISGRGGKDQNQSQGSSLTRFFRGNNSKGGRNHAKDIKKHQEKRDDSRHRRRNSSPHQVESFEYLNERDRCPPRDINVQQHQPYQTGYFPVMNPYAGCGGYLRVPPGYGYGAPPPGYGYPRPRPPPGMYTSPYPPAHQLRPIPPNLPYYNNNHYKNYHSDNEDMRRSDNRSTRSHKSSRSQKSSRSNKSSKSRKSVRRETLRRFLQEQHELASLALAKHAKNTDGHVLELEGKRYDTSASRKTKQQQLSSGNSTKESRRYDEIAKLLKDENNKNTTTDSSACCGCCGAGTWNIPFCCIPKIICVDWKYCVIVCR